MKNLSDIYGVVYFVGAKSAGPVMIGFTSDRKVSSRLSQLQTGSHEELAVLGQVDASPAVERTGRPAGNARTACALPRSSVPLVPAVVRGAGYLHVGPQRFMNSKRRGNHPLSTASRSAAVAGMPSWIPCLARSARTFSAFAFRLLYAHDVMSHAIPLHALLLPRAPVPHSAKTPSLPFFGRPLSLSRASHAAKAGGLLLSLRRGSPCQPIVHLLPSKVLRQSSALGNACAVLVFRWCFLSISGSRSGTLRPNLSFERDLPHKAAAGPSTPRWAYRQQGRMH